MLIKYKQKIKFYFFIKIWYYVLQGIIFCHIFAVSFKLKTMAVNIENIKSQMRKGFLEFCILNIINSKEFYVSDIIEELKKANLIVVEGTLYPLLMRLKNSGLLAYSWKESTQGPPRKYYTITEEGKSVLAELNTSWEEIKSSVELLKSNN